MPLVPGFMSIKILLAMILCWCLLTELYSYTEEPEFAENQTCYEEAVGGTRRWHLTRKEIRSLCCLSF